MDNGSQWSMTLERLPQGGYLVRDGDRPPGEYRTTHFAASTIDEALQFMRDKLNPIVATAPMEESSTSR